MEFSDRSDFSSKSCSSSLSGMGVVKEWFMFPERFELVSA